MIHAASQAPTGLYYNKLRENLPVFVGVVDNIKATFGMPVQAQQIPLAEAADVTQAEFMPKFGRLFRGHPVWLESLIGFDEFDEDDCERRMAWHLSKGYRACSVLRVLNQAELDDTGAIKLRTVAITLAENANFVKESAFEKYDFAYNDNAREANGAKCNGSSLPLSARFRNFIEVIGRVDA